MPHPSPISPRRPRRWPWAVGGAVVLLVVIGMSGNDDSATSTASTSATPSGTPTPTAQPVATSSVETPSPADEPITVARVVDGDTFQLTDGRKVRVLGIDSCEMSTYGGKEAKRAAEGQLQNSFNEPITMSAEPGGPDKDRYGRLLRYVSLNGSDFGEHMVKYDHTGVYQGDNDASPQYLQRLYAADLEYAQNPPAGRSCADPYPDTGSSGGDVDVDTPDGNLRDGALTGGYCARKWWC